MRTPCLFRLCLLALAVTFVHDSAIAAPTDKVVWNNPVEFTVAGLTHHSFASAAMGLEVGYSVWLPPGYASSGTRYPVIYFLHGTGGNESADAPAFSQIVAGLLAAKKIPAAICVFPNGGTSGYRDHPDTNVKVETMLIRELVPLIDREYRTRADRGSRALGGFSMGGGGSVRLALHYADLFSAAASWAGAFVRRDGDKTAPDFDPAPLQAPANRVRLLMIVGYDDFTLAWHAPALEGLQAAKYPYTFHLLAGVGHELGKYYDLTGEELVSFLTKEFPPATAP